MNMHGTHPNLTKHKPTNPPTHQPTTDKYFCVVDSCQPMVWKRSTARWSGSKKWRRCLTLVQGAFTNAPSWLASWPPTAARMTSCTRLCSKRCFDSKTRLGRPRGSGSMCDRCSSSWDAACVRNKRFVCLASEAIVAAPCPNVKAKCSNDKLQCSIAECSNADCSNALLPNAQMLNGQTPMLNCRMLKCWMLKCSNAEWSNPKWSYDKCSNAQMVKCLMLKCCRQCVMFNRARCWRQCWRLSPRWAKHWRDGLQPKRSVMLLLLWTNVLH